MDGFAEGAKIIFNSLTAPMLYLYARRLLRMGGSPTEAMLEPRRRQLQQTETLLRVFSGYWMLTGLAYLVGYAFETWLGEGDCDPYRPNGTLQPSTFKDIPLCEAALWPLEDADAIDG